MARSGQGTVLSYAATHNSVSPTKVAELTQAPFPKFSSGVIEEDIIDTVWDTVIPDGTTKLEEMTLSCNWTSAQFETLRGLVGLKRYFYLQFPPEGSQTAGARYVFEAIVKEVGGENVTKKAKIMNSITLTPTNATVPGTSPAAPVAYTAAS